MHPAHHDTGFCRPSPVWRPSPFCKPSPVWRPSPGTSLCLKNYNLVLFHVTHSTIWANQSRSTHLFVEKQNSITYEKNRYKLYITSAYLFLAWMCMCLLTFCTLHAMIISINYLSFVKWKKRPIKNSYSTNCNNSCTCCQHLLKIFSKYFWDFWYLKAVSRLLWEVT